MNQKKSSNKTTYIIGAVIIVAAVGGWYFYENGSSGSSSDSSVVASPASPGQGDVGADVLTILNSVSSIRIDSSFFSSPVYQSLVDYSIQVPSQAVGRSNPFAPIGASDSADASAPATGSAGAGQ